MIRDLLLLAFGAGVLLWAVRSLRLQRLKESYVILLSFTGLPFLVLAAWPDGLARISKWLAMPYHTLMVLVLTFFFIIVIFMLLSIVSMQDRRIATLAQTVGILMEAQKRDGEDRNEDSAAGEG